MSTNDLERVALREALEAALGELPPSVYVTRDAERDRAALDHRMAVRGKIEAAIALLAGAPPESRP